MPIFAVEKSIEIAAPVEKIAAIVGNLDDWRAWSPWAVAEPDADFSASPDGKKMSWDGKIIGAGEMRVANSEKNDDSAQIDYNLTFLKPFKSTNTAEFFLEKITAADNSPRTRATWKMTGNLPFFLFWMKKMMSVFVGMDYDRGLRMLKDYAETGAVPSQLEIIADHDFAGCHYVGVRTECDFADIGESMGSSMGALEKWRESAGIAPSGAPLAIYHDWKISSGICDYTIAFPVAAEKIPADLPAHITSGSVPACETYAIRHSGPYRHLGNAWATLMMHQRAKIYSPNKKIAPYEIYENDPMNTPENALRTLCCYPQKK